MPEETTSHPAPHDGSGHAPPLILFDGVCNLCDAAVQWVIERDRRGVFRFASLQSEAAARELLHAGAPQPRPDSIVLIDRAGVHMRSTAAIRIAQRLGFPYWLLAVFLLVPRPVRDAVYAVIARHRYRWFGRRDVCMVPAPNLVERFYDADEPRRPMPESAARPSGGGRKDAAPDDRAVSWPGALCTRFIVVYLLLYIAPFPLTLVGQLLGVPILDAWLPAGLLEWTRDGVGTLIRYGDPIQLAVPWVGSTLLGVDAELAFTGSGDRTFNYVELLLDLAAASVITALWTAIRGARRTQPGLFELSRVLGRYYLGTTMLTYGWVKVFPLQFPVPGPERLLQPYGDSSPMGLAWTFLGASTGYQIFAGLAELLGGYLLLFRRTAFTGALVTAAVMANVAALNYFYDVPVKLFSTHLLLVALFIAGPDLPRLLGVLLLHVPVAPARIRAPWARWAWLALIVVIAKATLIVGLTTQHVQSGVAAMRTRGAWAAPHPLEGMYRVESFMRDGIEGRANEDAVRWVRIGLTPTYAAAIQHATGDVVRLRMALDEEAMTISFFDRGAAAPEVPQFEYAQLEPGRLRLEGSFEGVKVVVVLRRDDAEPLLRSRGFRWINEYPFNR